MRTRSGGPWSASGRGTVAEPRNRVDYSRQLLDWLMDEFPIDRDVELIWVTRIPMPDHPDKDSRRQGAWAEVGEYRGRFQIRLSDSRNRTYGDTRDSLFHEFAHCLDWDRAAPESTGSEGYHGDHFAILLWRINRAYEEGGGWAKRKRL